MCVAVRYSLLTVPESKPKGDLARIRTVRLIRLFFSVDVIEGGWTSSGNDSSSFEICLVIEWRVGSGTRIE